MGALSAGNVEDKVDVSAIRDEDKAYLRAYVSAALNGRSFRGCAVTWPQPTEGDVAVRLVFDDGSGSESIEVPAEVAFVLDRRDEVVYDDSGRRKTVLGFAQDGVLKALIDSVFRQKRVR
jgi:hypothetical protein